MSELEDKLNAVLSNPQMMQQIMTLAQSMNQAPGEQPSGQAAPAPPPALPPIDMGLLQKLSGLARQSGVDSNQQELLHALSHYLSHRRVEKLERAMRAAKLTELASSLIGSGTLQSLIGR